MQHIRRKDNKKIVANFYDINRAIQAYKKVLRDVYELIDEDGNIIKTGENNGQMDEN
ncbi:hypothetical protein LCGC14_0871940 [marine sediment metagenome]|uniref:Uncharacterized protein n=1 Tax=marine sediment metagenome TaxID=412755 RepID=A0A0F9SBE0_9ZZZZ